MSITDELREWANGFANGFNGPWKRRKELRALEDYIDANFTFDMKPMTDENMAEHGWVRGPLDADGEMWRSGDMSDSRWGVIEGIAYEDGRWLVRGHDISAPWMQADSIRHYHAPTVEDVLRDFAKCWDDPAHYAKGELVEKYADRIREAVHDEEDK